MLQGKQNNLILSSRLGFTETYRENTDINLWVLAKKKKKKKK